MLAAGNAEQGGGDTSVRNDAAEGLLRLSCRGEGRNIGLMICERALAASFVAQAAGAIEK